MALAHHHTDIATPRWPDRLRLPIAFDPAPVAAEIAALEADAWIEHFVRQNYDGAWDVIPLRADATATHPIKMIYSDPTATAFVDTPFLARMPAAQAVLAQFRCPLTVVRVMRLGPGSTIREHFDDDLAAENGVARIHLPITTSPDVTFLLSGAPVALAAGSAWYLRLSDPHSVVNAGRAARDHIVIDAVVDAWLAGLLDHCTSRAADSIVSDSSA